MLRQPRRYATAITVVNGSKTYIRAVCANCIHCGSAGSECDGRFNVAHPNRQGFAYHR